MASSQTLRQYDQNRTRPEDTRNTKTQSKDVINPKTPVSKRGTENQDPLARDGKVRQGGTSRLPVLAKTHVPQAHTDFTQAHRKWEQSFLKGKAQKKRPCTKPVPFSLSQRPANRAAAGGQRKAQSTKPGATKPQPLQSARNAASQPAQVSGSASLTTLPVSAGAPGASLPTRPQARQVAETITHLSQTPGSTSRSEHPAPGTVSAAWPGRGPEQPLQSKGLLPGQRNWAPQPTGGSATSATGPTVPSSRDCRSQQEATDLSWPTSADHRDAVSAQESQHAPATAQPGQAESVSCQLNLQGVSKAAMGASQPAQLKNPLQSKDGIQLSDSTLRNQNVHGATDPISAAGGGVQFSPDPAALRTILQNEGVKAGVPLGTTPRNSVCPTGRTTSVYLPQRVSVVKSRPGPGVAAGGGVQFSPDPAALSSILQNEGVKAGGPLGATPRSSVCPSGRGTSIYLPQRVPVTKGRHEAAGVTAGVALSQTPAVKWTPLRVPNTKPQSMRRLLSSHQTPIFRGSPRLGDLQSHRKELRAHKEEDVVQRLFEEVEQEEDTKTDAEADRVTDRVTDQPSTSDCPTGEGDPEEGRGISEKEGAGDRGTQPFIPPPHRESVIVFSSSAKKAVSGPRSRPSPQDPESFLHLEALLENRSDRPPGSDLPAPPEILQRPPSALNRPQGGAIHWLPRLLSGGPTVRRPLEEMLLDEECAAFTSRSPAPPTHPRCGNPVASTLLLQSSACFAPICLAPETPRDPPVICCPVVLSA